MDTFVLCVLVSDCSIQRTERSDCLWISGKSNLSLSSPRNQRAWTLYYDWSDHVQIEKTSSWCEAIFDRRPFWSERGEESIRDGLFYVTDDYSLDRPESMFSVPSNDRVENFLFLEELLLSVSCVLCNAISSRNAGVGTEYKRFNWITCKKKSQSNWTNFHFLR